MQSAGNLPLLMVRPQRFARTSGFKPHSTLRHIQTQTFGATGGAGPAPTWRRRRHPQPATATASGRDSLSGAVAEVVAARRLARGRRRIRGFPFPS